MRRFRMRDGASDNDEFDADAPPASRQVRLPAPALLGLLYAGLILAGAIVLMLPVSATGARLDLSEALFMSTSAVTVTGLVVVDPGTALTGFGQATIAALIQLGGLGLMSFAVIVMSSLGLPIGLAQREYLKEDLGQTSIDRLLGLVRIILRVVIIAVAIGTALLATVFVPDLGWREGLWQSLFHAVSAFNNAGFSLFPNSLSDYAAHPTVNIVVPGLFIVGGLGFVVVAEVVRLRRWRAFSLHTKIMLTGTAALIALSTFAICALEWHNPGTLGAFDSRIDRFQAGWFQAVTTRTAGFNTVDTSLMTDASTFMTTVLMVIGGGSTSTAGGIKVTTFVVMLLAIIAFFRRQTQLNAFGHSIELEQILKVMALVTVSLFVIVSAFFALLVTQEADFEPLLFETASAFGTVGLSLGATGELDHFGRAVICLVMFLGRVGPLTLGFFLAARLPPRVRYPSSPIHLG